MNHHLKNGSLRKKLEISNMYVVIEFFILIWRIKIPCDRVVCIRLDHLCAIARTWPCIFFTIAPGYCI